MNPQHPWYYYPKSCTGQVKQKLIRWTPDFHHLPSDNDDFCPDKVNWNIIIFITVRKEWEKFHRNGARDLLE